MSTDDEYRARIRNAVMRMRQRFGAASSTARKVERMVATVTHLNQNPADLERELSNIAEIAEGVIYLTDSIIADSMERNNA